MQHQPNEEAEAREKLSQFLAQALLQGQLDARDHTILQHRLGLLGGRYASLAEIGRAFGIKRERVRQRQNVALRKLRPIPGFSALFLSYVNSVSIPSNRHQRPYWQNWTTEGEVPTSDEEVKKPHH